MADFQHWRRMIHSTKGRSPAIEHDEVISTSPKRALRPRLPSYLNLHPVSASSERHEFHDGLFGNGMFDSESTLLWQGEDSDPRPQIDILIEGTMQHLLCRPFEPLDARYNSTILRICEGFRDIVKEKEHLQVQLDDLTRNYETIMRSLQQAQARWLEEKEEYKREVKRLELLLAKGKRGLAEVTLARQDSELRHRSNKGANDGLETVFEFLEKSQRAEETVWDAQRASFKKRLPSPSAGMRRLSQQLLQKKSMTNIYPDLPFGTPPPDRKEGVVATSLVQTRQYGSGDHRCADMDSSEPRTSVSDDTYSAFSCAGDLFPNEASDGTFLESVVFNEDIAFIKSIAERVAHCRNVDATEMMSKILELFALPSVLSNREELATDKRSASAPDALRIHGSVIKSTVLDRIKPGIKQPSVMKKASGFFQRRLKPQPSLQTSNHTRRFSFEIGDDTRSIALFAADTGTGNGEDYVRRSVSMSSLPTHRAHSGSLHDGSPLALSQSPTTSTRTSGSRRASRIPTPVHCKGKRRVEREESASSLLTVIRHSTEVPKTDSSLPSASPLATTSISVPDHGTQVVKSKTAREAMTKRQSSNALLDFANNVRRHSSFTMASPFAQTLPSMHDHSSKLNRGGDTADA